MADKFENLDDELKRTYAQLNKKSLFSRIFDDENKYEDIADRLTRLAHKYFTIGIRAKAGEILSKAAECYLKAGYEYGAIKSYRESFTMYKKDNVATAISMIKNSISLACDNGDYYGASKDYMELGELYEREFEYEKAIECYEEADKIYEPRCSTCKIKIAEIIVHIGVDLHKAIECYEQLAADWIDTNRRFGVSRILNKAGLCHIIHDVVMAEHMISQYEQCYNQCKFLREILESVKTDDIDLFNKLVKSREYEFDKTEITLLVRIKRGFNTEDNLT